MTDTEILAAIRRLTGLLHVALDQQWQKPPVEHAERVGGKSSGVSDPTADIALDQTRWSLRDEVVQVGQGVRALADDLEAELDRFNSRGATR